MKLKLARAEDHAVRTPGSTASSTGWSFISSIARRRSAPRRRLLAPGGRACVVTFDSTYFSDFWLNQYFPRFEAIRSRTLLDGRASSRMSYARPDSGESGS